MLSWSALANDIAWMRDALCAEPEYVDVRFFAEKGQSVGAAQAVCARCTVREECLAYAEAEDITAGVWGGLTPKGRKARRAAAPA